MAPVIELDSLEVQLGNRIILKGLSGSLTGRAIGLLGPNGAGKTTTVSMIAGLLPPDAGEVLIEGSPLGGDTDPIKAVLAEQLAGNLDDAFPVGGCLLPADLHAGAPACGPPSTPNMMLTM